MNQILYTGGKGKKSGASETNKIVIFFVVGIIIFAIAVIAIGTFLFTKVKNENPGETGNTNTVENEVETPTVKANIKIEFESELGGVKILVTSDTTLTNISYWWDNEAATITEISDTEYDTVVASKPGTHTLNVAVTDENGNKADASQMVIGDAGPEITILTDGVSNYVIRVKDDELIKKVQIELNDVMQELDVNNTEYECKVPIPQGDSLIKVTAYNLNDLSTEKKAKITNFGG